jgi:hypothetical protein
MEGRQVVVPMDTYESASGTPNAEHVANHPQARSAEPKNQFSATR